MTSRKPHEVSKFLPRLKNKKDKKFKKLQLKKSIYFNKCYLKVVFNPRVEYNFEYKSQNHQKSDFGTGICNFLKIANSNFDGI